MKRISPLALMAHARKRPVKKYEEGGFVLAPEDQQYLLNFDTSSSGGYNLDTADLDSLITNAVSDTPLLDLPGGDMMISDILAGASDTPAPVINLADSSTQLVQGPDGQLYAVVADPSAGSMTVPAPTSTPTVTSSGLPEGMALDNSGNLVKQVDFTDPTRAVVAAHQAQKLPQGTPKGGLVGQITQPLKEGYQSAKTFLFGEDEKPGIRLAPGETGQYVGGNIMKVTAKDGTERYVNISGQPTSSGSGSDLTKWLGGGLSLYLASKAYQDAKDKNKRNTEVDKRNAPLVEAQNQAALQNLATQQALNNLVLQRMGVSTVQPTYQGATTSGMASIPSSVSFSPSGGGSTSAAPSRGRTAGVVRPVRVN